jgi:hypothetical protein
MFSLHHAIDRLSIDTRGKEITKSYPAIFKKIVKNLKKASKAYNVI